MHVASHANVSLLGRCTLLLLPHPTVLLALEALPVYQNVRVARVSSAQGAAEACLAGAEFHDHVLRRQAVAMLQVSGDGELLAEVAQTRPLAAVRHRFLQKTFARHVAPHVFLEAQGFARREQAAADIADGGVGDIENARGGRCWLMVSEAEVVVSGRVKSCPRRQIAAFFEPGSAVNERQKQRPVTRSTLQNKLNLPFHRLAVSLCRAYLQMSLKAAGLARVFGVERAGDPPAFRRVFVGLVGRAAGAAKGGLRHLVLHAKHTDLHRKTTKSLLDGHPKPADAGLLSRVAVKRRDVLVIALALSKAQLRPQELPAAA